MTLENGQLIKIFPTTPNQIVSFFKDIKIDSSRGFVAGLFCGSCIRGPGVYADWEDKQERRVHELSRSEASYADNGKLPGSVINAGRDAVQLTIVIQNPVPTNQEVLMQPRQTMTNVNAGRSVKKGSNIPIEQIMQQVEAAGNISQMVEATSKNLDIVAPELEKLYAELERCHPSAMVELQRVKESEQAAKNMDGGNVIKNLKGTAQWIAEFATKIGTSVVAKILEKQIGL